jgi:hypothetical protein
VEAGVKRWLAQLPPIQRNQSLPYRSAASLSQYPLWKREAMVDTRPQLDLTGAVRTYEFHALRFALQGD